MCKMNFVHFIKPVFDKASSQKVVLQNHQWSQNTISTSADVPRRPPQLTIDMSDPFGANIDDFSHQPDQGGTCPSR